MVDLKTFFDGYPDSWELVYNGTSFWFCVYRSLKICENLDEWKLHLFEKTLNYIENSEELKEHLDDDEKLLMTNGSLSESRVEILAITKILNFTPCPKLHWELPVRRTFNMLAIE